MILDREEILKTKDISLTAEGQKSKTVFSSGMFYAEIYNVNGRLIFFETNEMGGNSYAGSCWIEDKYALDKIIKEIESHT